MVRSLQDKYCGGRHSQIALHTPDFCALAGAFGIASERADTPEALEQAVRSGTESGRPYLIEVMI